MKRGEEGALAQIIEEIFFKAFLISKAIGGESDKAVSAAFLTDGKNSKSGGAAVSTLFG